MWIIILNTTKNHFGFGSDEGLTLQTLANIALHDVPHTQTTFRSTQYTVGPYANEDGNANVGMQEKYFFLIILIFH